MDNMNNNMPYPELYEQVYPKCEKCLDKHEAELPAEMYPSEEKMKEMVDEVYEELAEEYPEVAEDPAEKRYRNRSVGSQQRPYYGRRRLARDFISLVLLSQLFGRRRRRPGFGYGGYPGYGYGRRPGYGYDPGYGYGPGYGSPGYDPYGY